jgi:hypothetical protein
VHGINKEWWAGERAQAGRAEQGQRGLLLPLQLLLPLLLLLTRTSPFLASATAFSTSAPMQSFSLVTWDTSK